MPESPANSVNGQHDVQNAIEILSAWLELEGKTNPNRTSSFGDKAILIRGKSLGT
jgi:hypothetical protein